MSHITNAPIKPRRLAPGDTIGIVAPSEPVNEANLAAGVEFLRREGFEVVLGHNIRARSGHLAGSDEQRAEDLNRFFNDRDIDAIFCAAGGANSARLLPLLDYEALRRRPKIVLGLSDPTALLCAVHAVTGLVTFHGPVVQYNFSSPMSPFTDKYFRRAILTTEPIGAINELTADNVLREGAAVGRLVGGNLSTLVQLIGTPYEPSWDGAILFWEDVAEQPHALDARLTHLRNAGVFDRLAGMIVGRLEACEEHDYEDVPSTDDIVLTLTRPYAFPILRDVELGHTDNKLTIPIGANAEIGSGAVLSIGESGVI